MVEKSKIIIRLMKSGNILFFLSEIPGFFRNKCGWLMVLIFSSFAFLCFAQHLLAKPSSHSDDQLNSQWLPYNLPY